MVKREVKDYAHYESTVNVYFPNNEVLCRWCPFLKCEQAYSRYRCIITDEYILSPQAVIGSECPLERKESR